MCFCSYLSCLGFSVLYESVSWCVFVNFGKCLSLFLQALLPHTFSLPILRLHYRVRTTRFLTIPAKSPLPGKGPHPQVWGLEYGYFWEPLFCYQSCYRPRYHRVQATRFSCNFIVLSLQVPLVVLGSILDRKKWLQHILQELKSFVLNCLKITYSKGKFEVFHEKNLKL